MLQVSLFSSVFSSSASNCLCFHLRVSAYTCLYFLFLSAMSVSLISQSHMPISFQFRSTTKSQQYRNGCRLLSTSLQYHDRCLTEWRGTAGHLHYPPLIYSGREHRWELPSSWHFAHSSESKELQVPSLCHDSITVATELINPVFPAAFVRKHKADTSWADSAHKLQ